METRKGPLYENMVQDERILRSFGVPSRYVRSKREDLGRMFSVTMDRDWVRNAESLKISVAQQNEVIEGLFAGKLLLQESLIIGVGSEPTDHCGMVFGAALCRRAYDMGLRPKMINTRRNPGEVQFNQPPDLVVFYGAKSDCNVFRADVCRDWLSFFDDTFLVMIVAGTNPMSFFYNRLHSSLDAALYFQGDSGVEDRKYRI